MALRAQYAPRQGEWLHFSYSYLNMRNAPEPLRENWKSNTWQLQFMNEFYFGTKSHFSLGYGLGVSTFNYHNNLRITTAPSGNISYAWLAADSTYERNRLSASYVDIPVEIRFRSNTNKYGRYFRFYLGGLVGYRFSSNSHFKNGDYSITHHRIRDLANWHYAVYMRTGFWIFNLFASYNINPTFKTNPQDWEMLNTIHSLQLGVSVSL